jgi:hypothetical protein
MATWQVQDDIGAQIQAHVPECGLVPIGGTGVKTAEAMLDFLQLSGGGFPIR